MQNQLQIVVRVYVLCGVVLGVDVVARVSSWFFMLTWTYVVLYTRLSYHLFDVFVVVVHVVFVEYLSL